MSLGYPPIDGGVATSVERIAKQFHGAGLAVMVLTFAYAPSGSVDDYVEVEEVDGIHVRRVGPYYRHDSAEQTELSVVRRRAYDQMERLAATWEPDLIFSFYAANPGLFGTYLSAALQLPHILCLRGNDIGRNIFSTTWLPILDIMLQRAAHITCVNSHLKNRLLTAFPAVAKKTSIIRNSVVLPDLVKHPGRPSVRSIAGWGESIVAVFIGTPREKKGIVTLLRAFEMASCRASLRLLIVGPEIGEAERRTCGTLWDRLCREGLLHCTGWLDRATAMSVSCEGDLVVMPSLEDGLANGLLEGMALGLCPIATSIFSDVITHRETGIIVPVGNESSLSGALEEGAKDASLRRTLAMAAKRSVNHQFAPARELNEYLDLVEEVLGRDVNKSATPTYLAL